MAERDYSINPTAEDRHKLLRESLDRAGRSGDFENIVELLSPPPDIFEYAPISGMKNIKIGIIGAGLAGLSAAYELRKLGAEITIFDAEKDRLGGRVYTYYFDRPRQYYGELGASRVPVSHETAWHYIDLFRLDTETLVSEHSNDFIYAHNVRIRRDQSGRSVTENLYPYYDLTAVERKTPWNVLSNYAANSILNRLTPELRSEILKILPAYSEEYAAITRLSSRQIFEMLGLSQGAISLISAVEPFTGALLNVSYDEILNTNYTLDFLNTYRVSGGMVRLAKAFFSSLANDDPPEFEPPSYFLGKVNFRFGQVITGIFQSLHSGKVELRSYRTKGNESFESFDYVLCAIPFSTLREIEITPFFSNQKMQAIKEWNYINSQKTIALCRKRFWEEDTDYGRINGGASFTDLPIQSILYPLAPRECGYPQNHCSPDAPGVLTMAYNLTQDAGRVFNQPEDLRFQIIKHNVESVHGLPEGYLDNIIHSHKTVEWNSQYWSRGAFAAGLPGQKINFLYTMQQPEYQNRVFFAGEHISAKQGWMQGALYSGKYAANQIAQNAKLMEGDRLAESIDWERHYHSYSS